MVVSSGWIHCQTCDFEYPHLFSPVSRYFEKDRSDVACRVVNVKGNKFQDGRVYICVPDGVLEFIDFVKKTAKRLEFVIETPNDTLAKSYKFACDKEEEYNQ